MSKKTSSGSLARLSAGLMGTIMLASELACAGPTTASSTTSVSAPGNNGQAVAPAVDGLFAWDRGYEQAIMLADAENGSAGTKTQEVATNTADRFPLLGDRNEIDNPNQIDRPDELAQASDGPASLSADDLSKELANPNSPLASLTFKQTYTAFNGSLPGAGDQSSSVTLFQPTFPFPLTDDGTTNLFIRPGIPYFWEQPVFDAATNSFDTVSGFGDWGFDVALGRSFDSGHVVVGGVQGTLPFGADRLSADQYRLGPEFLIAKLDEKGFWAVFPAHQWDISGGDRDYSTSQLELFYGRYLPNAWTVYTDSKWFYDWENDQATIPLNLTVRKVTKLGNMPLKLELSFDYFVESDDRFGQDWAVTLNIAPVVPNFIYDAFR